ncbi:nucleoside/nucleotide kinase family protein [Zhihengliuella salsuginis]|uniref:Nucleoside/nucleotide kinase family protein n=1 Tax=Zhihengliuella salsuginis TaxID=578222 RepID=A0ABQ3GBA8_9MICC|nr:nucleoside/nucleotide kinase family protein [Zhihengliuella salsuginis]GHC99556.1 nucleoside/nucleotide kinase family protein [Zhihengliuella salsuginis]
MHNTLPPGLLDPRGDSALGTAVERIAQILEQAQGRVFLGIAGSPGAGKSTLATLLAERFGAAAAVVPMDGFHLSDRVLSARGALERKGAIDTFDADGYVALLRRLGSEADRPVFAPRFERDLEEPIAAGLEIPPTARLIITEGNYLLAEADPWRRLREICAEIWFVDPPPDVRLERLVARHELFGKSPEAARAWVSGTDEVNARIVERTRDRADRVIPCA